MTTLSSNLMSKLEFEALWDSNRTAAFNSILSDPPKCFGKCAGDACPLNFGNAATEYSQSIGCGLPTPKEIAEMRAVSGVTWACHEDANSPCVGGQHFCKALGIDTTILKLKTEF